MFPQATNHLYTVLSDVQKLLQYRPLFVQGAEFMDVFNYDENSLICYDMSVYYNEGKLKEKPFYHMIISKKDGSVVKGIPVPFDIVKAPFVHSLNYV